MQIGHGDARCEGRIVRVVGREVRGCLGGQGVELHRGHAAVDALDDLLRDVGRVHKLHVEAIRELLDARRDLVKLHALGLAIALLDEHGAGVRGREGGERGGVPATRGRRLRRSGCLAWEFRALDIQCKATPLKKPRRPSEFCPSDSFFLFLPKLDLSALKTIFILDSRHLATSPFRFCPTLTPTSVQTWSKDCATKPPCSAAARRRRAQSQASLHTHACGPLPRCPRLLRSARPLLRSAALGSPARSAQRAHSATAPPPRGRTPRFTRCPLCGLPSSCVWVRGPLAHQVRSSRHGKPPAQAHGAFRGLRRGARARQHWMRQGLSFLRFFAIPALCHAVGGRCCCVYLVVLFP